LKSIFSK